MSRSVVYSEFRENIMIHSDLFIFTGIFLAVNKSSAWSDSRVQSSRHDRKQRWADS